jgi:transcriptional regulator with XRE-family HTH domain
VWGSDDPDAYGLVEDADGESRDYTTEQYDKLRWTFAPPVLWGEGAKLQKPWFYAFLNDPMPLRPQLRVRMPSFNFPAGHAGSIADYFASKAALAWPADLARRMRIAEGVDVAQMASAIGISADTLRGIENGSRPDTEARFAEVLAYAAKTGFRFMPAVNTEHERLVRRSPSYLDHVSEAHADYLSLGNTLAREGPQCFQCHFDDGVAPNADPIAWGPDLVRVRERLREDWVYRWMENPSRIYPGTAMPGNFLSDPPQYQAVYPDSSNPQQINAVVDWLFNYDRVPPHN